MKFNPQPGDKIICNNGEEFICCTKEDIEKNLGFPIYQHEDILGYQSAPLRWQDWDSAGVAEGDVEYEYNIREVIPAKFKEVVKEEEPRYTLEEIKEAWDASGWVAATTTWNTFRGNLVKNDAEYKEYLRLKAIYE